MKKYLLREWKEVGEPEVSEINEKELWIMLQNKDTKRKFAIFEIGDCIIDWS